MPRPVTSRRITTYNRGLSMSASLQWRSSRSTIDTANAVLSRLAASRAARVLFIGHAMGGGVRRHMFDLASLVAGDCHVLWARPGPGGTLEIDVNDGEGAFTAYFALPAELPALLALLRDVGITRVHLHHLHGMPRAILDVLSNVHVPYDVTLHDYFAQQPDGQSFDNAREDDVDAATQSQGVPWDMSLGEWRRTHRDLLRAAARVVAPSHDVARRFARAWPELDIIVKPHPEWPRAPLPRIVRVIAPGRLSPEKGLHVVAACALHAREHGLPLFFRIVGCTTEAVPQSPHAPLSVSGEYPESALPDILAAEAPDVMLFPTQVPESYGYLLSTAIASGVPIVASALGAYVERLAHHPACATLPHDAQPAAWNRAIMDLARSHAGAPIGRTAAALTTGTPPDDYRAFYLAPFGAAPATQGPVTLDPRHLELPRRDVGPESPPLADLYTYGVECGQMESRSELKRRIDAYAEDRAAIEEEKEVAYQEQQRAQARADQAAHALRLAHARIDEFEHSTSWRITAPVRWLGHRWKLVQARLRASYATARHVPRQADIARTIWRDHGTAALANRVWTKVAGKRRYRPPVVTRYVQETATGALSFPKLSSTAPRVSIVIPAFGAPLLTYSCLKSILSNTPAGRYEVIVIDDASPEPVAHAMPQVTGIRI